MKIQTKHLLLLLITAMMFGQGCKKDKDGDNGETPVKKGSITGKIIVPEGMRTSSDGWKVNSGFEEVSVQDGKYTIGVAEEGFSLQFVSDATGKDVLLGLKYPGQTDFTIDASGTVVALLMQLPAVGSLTTEGKQNLIRSVRSNSHFIGVVESLETRLAEGKELFDTTGNSFFEQLGTLFEASALRTGGVSQNINLIRSGKNLTFQNPGKPFAQVIGIYKDNQRIHRIELDRYQYFVGSLTAIPGAIGNPDKVIEQTYTLGGDGEYEIRVRTGNMLGDLEATEALKANLANLSLDYIGSLLRFIPLADLNQSCVKDIRSWTESRVNGVVGAIGGSGNIGSGHLIGLMTEISLGTIELIKTSQSCIKTPSETGFLSKLSGIFKFVDKVSQVSQILNTGVFLYQWQTTPAKSDTCFAVKGNEVKSCEEESITDPRDGEKYKIVKIGTQTWFAENLRYSGSIPNVTGATTQQPAWAYYDNIAGYHATHGKLYNWYAVNTGTLCPPGWHIPTIAEWNILISYLGGGTVAGAKMKNTTGWAGDGNGDNSSGFTGLPSGRRRGSDGKFEAMRTNGYWWSSTEHDTYTDDALYKYLFYFTSDVGNLHGSKRGGFSCRCLRD